MHSTGLFHLQVNIRPEHQIFDRELLGDLGWTTIYDHPLVFAARGANGPALWFESIAKDVPLDYDGPGVNHIAIGASSASDVDALTDWLAVRGIACMFGTPRHRPEFAGEPADYYQVMFESPDGILFEFVYNGPMNNVCPPTEV